MQKALLYAGSLVVHHVRAIMPGTDKNQQLIKGFITMKLLVLLTIAACLQAGATGYGQTITLLLKDARLEQVFREIEKQSDYRFIYTREQLENTSTVKVDVRDASIKTVLDICFNEQPVTYTLKENYIIIKRKEKSKADESNFFIPLKTISGRISDEDAKPITAATIVLKGSSIGTASDSRGEWKLEYEGNFSSILISSIGYKTREIAIGERNFFNVVLERQVNDLDETIIIAYGRTTQRLNTGSVSKVSASEISKQPVSNVLAALEGRVAGLIVNQTTGITGGKFKVEIRGRNSIVQGSEPLIVIDGVPLASNNNNLNQLTSALASFAGQGLSPLNGLNPSDIESIEILKDADATAIYGSRGANGVILITTKKGKSGRTRINANAYTGFSKVTRSMDMMNTRGYVRMRKEAFANDGVTPGILNAYDLLVWDTTRYTDLKRLLTGGNAYLSDAQVSVSGGDEQTQFLIGAGYHYESSIFSRELADKRGSFHLNLNHRPNGKFGANFIANYSYDKNEITSNDLTGYVTLPPNLPSLFKTDGNLNWEEQGTTFTNPLADLLRRYVAKTDNLLSNLQLSYQLIGDLSIKTSLGYNTILVDEANAFPKLSQNPQSSPLASAIFGSNRFNSWSVEPQAEYKKIIGRGKLSILIGGTWQETVNKRSTIQASGYSNDALLGSVNGASTLRVTDGYTQYRYQALFGRINYNRSDRYILNLTGRRDGSSRFGPNKQFANFGAGGAAWIFSNENFIKKGVSFLSYGKLRGSYGTTGNDQIGDYQFLDAWNPVTNRYQGPSVIPSRLFNADYGWEINKKLEGSIELGFLKDRILLSASYFRNRSSNQLINYRLPGQTGFQSIIRNFPALIENSGWEFSLVTKNLSGTVLNWTSSLNVTIPKNKLVSFPGLRNSSYAFTYVEGRSLSTVYGYHLKGVDAASGVYLFEDVDRNGSIGSTDYMASFNLDPKFYGGLNNVLTYRNAELSFFFEFRKQMGYNYNNYPVNGFAPGMMFNLPSIMVNRWQKPGDKTSIQRFTQTFTPAFDAQYNFTLSDGRFSDASYIRLKNVSVSYSLPESLHRKIHLTGCRVYLLGQNLLTITDYKGSDPETQNLFVLPPLKTFTAGVQLTF